MHRSGAIGELQDEVRLFKAPGDLPAGVADVVGDVGRQDGGSFRGAPDVRRVSPGVRPHPGASARPDPRRVRRHRLQGIHHGGQWFDIHLDPSGAVRRRSLGLRQDHGDRLAVIHHALPGQQRPRVALRLPLEPWEIRRGQHGNDAGDGAGGGGFDPPEAAVGIRAEDHAGIQEIGQSKVSAELQAPRRLQMAIPHGNPLTDGHRVLHLPHRGPGIRDTDVSSKIGWIAKAVQNRRKRAPCRVGPEVLR